jgi:hypothetical protein
MAFEDIVTDHLVANMPDHWILPTHDFKVTGSGGPRMQRDGKKDIIMPDYMMIKAISKEMTLVEAKCKKKPFSLVGFNNQRFIGIEEYKVQDYRHAANLLNADLLFVVGDESTREMHMIKDQKFHIHNFNNKFSSVNTCCLELTDLTKVGTY